MDNSSSSISGLVLHVFPHLSLMEILLRLVTNLVADMVRKVFVAPLSSKRIFLFLNVASALIWLWTRMDFQGNLIWFSSITRKFSGEQKPVCCTTGMEQYHSKEMLGMLLNCHNSVLHSWRAIILWVATYDLHLSSRLLTVRRPKTVTNLVGDCILF